ncbi:orotidine-5'-phosphate decarboxylase [Thermococcus sp. 101 C5]|uniref:orotidine-5'-phosphate decarboxylase n=1 Tax=Thermococcus sp. 101 C5 TaxID=2654197 RepID=UPI00128B0517|nr:orotidine-5'-phosphate decarboxylase [Thermococcus sp. 101 C5]MPW38159.1 orotidine-5'-phosphate decarboxylase [Thermococcus sp. 101 C5]
MFIKKYRKARDKNSSILVVGLDSDPGKIKGSKSVVEFNEHIIKETADLVCGYKINIAFYEKLGWGGYMALEETIELIKNETNLPVILDAKRGDIGNTARAYAKAYFDRLGVDSVTVNPYMGRDAIIPFLEKGHAFILLLTSNESIGDVELHVYPRVLELAKELEKSYPERVGIVVGATRKDHISKISNASGDLSWLIPGIGAQGGDPEVLKELKRRDVVVNVSRAIIFAENVRKKAAEFRELLARQYFD